MLNHHRYITLQLSLCSVFLVFIPVRSIAHLTAAIRMHAFYLLCDKLFIYSNVIHNWIHPSHFEFCDCLIVCIVKSTVEIKCIQSVSIQDNSLYI